MFDPKQFEIYREDNRLEVKAANGGLEEPTVEEKFGNPDRTVLTLPLTLNIGSDIGTNTTTNTTTSGDVEDKLQAIVRFCEEPRSRAEIQE